MFQDDDRAFTYSATSELDLDEAIALGARNPERAWILTDRDLWHSNPHYFGPEVPHPESFDGDFRTIEEQIADLPFGAFLEETFLEACARENRSDLIPF